MTSNKSLAGAVSRLKIQLFLQSVNNQAAEVDSCDMRESHKWASSIPRYQILYVKQTIREIFPTVKVLFSVSSS